MNQNSDLELINKYLLIGDKKDDIIVLNDSTEQIEYIYHISDIHIGKDNERHDEYILIFNKLIKTIESYCYKNCLICITGDILDFKNNITSIGTDMLITFLKMLSDLYPMVIIAGENDVNIRGDNIDLISCVYNKIKVKNTIYYLKQSGLYRYNNIIFTVASIFDKKVILTDKTVSKNKKILLHHGLINCDKLTDYNYISNKSDLRLDYIQDYDMVLLGGIHKKLFISDNIAYCPSLIQRSYEESVKEHGMIIWDINTNRGTYVEIPNDYCYVTFNFENNKLINNIEYITKNIRVKIRYNKTDDIIIDKFIKGLSDKYTIIQLDREKLYDNDDISIELLDGKRINKVSLTDDKSIIELLKKYMIEIKKYDKSKEVIKDVINIHTEYFNKLKKREHKSKKIRLVSLKYSNIYSYGADNEIDFRKIKRVTGIVAPNHCGKSSIVDIIIYVLYDRTLRIAGTKKIDIMNVHKRNFMIELELYIDDQLYKIRKTGQKNKKQIDRQMSIYKNIDGEYKEFSSISFNEAKKIVTELIGISYEDFIFSCLMPQYGGCEILDIDNIKRKEIISKFLMLDFFDDIYDRVKSDIKISQHILDTKYNENRERYEKILQYESVVKKYSDLKKLNNSYKTKIDLKRRKLDQLRNKIKNMIDLDSINIKTINSEINEYKNKYKKITKELFKINKDIKETEGIAHNIINTSKITSKISNIVKKDLIQKIRSDDIYKENKKIIEDIIDIIKPIEDDDNINTTVFNLIKSNIDNIKEQNDRLHILYDRKNTLNDDINKTNETIKKLTKYNKIVRDNNKIFMNINKINVELDNLELEYNDNKKEIELYDNMTYIYTKLKEEYKTNEKEIKEMKNKLDILNIYLESVSKDGIILMIFKLVCKSIENNVNNILCKFSDIKIKVELTETKNKSYIDIIKLSGVKEYNAVNCSGFERLAINLAFKIAMINYSNLSIPSFLIIDETISCIDKWNLEKIDKLFDYFREIYDFSMIITHIDKIQDKFDSIIQIEKYNGVSKLIH